MDQPGVVELITLAQKGDKKAFCDLMELHQGMAYRLAYRLAGEADAAEEIVQDAFLQAWRSLAQFKGRSRFSTWLYSIVVRKSADRHRRLRRHQGIASLDEQMPAHKDVRRDSTPTPLEMLQGEELSGLILQAMSKLPVEQRAALVLTGHEGLSCREAAEALNCSAGTVAWRVWNARRLLKELLKAHI